MPNAWSGSGAAVLVLVGLVCVVLFILFGCSKESESNRPAAQPVSERIIFRSPDGRELKENELEGITGTFSWELVGSGNVPQQARQQHELARQAGGRGDYAGAVKSCIEASRLAPNWPYPVYDLAWTYLLMDDVEKAEKAYGDVLKLSPRGFFTAITAADCLRREREGDLPRGLYKNLTMLEWMSDNQEKKKLLEGVVAKHPSFAPAWFQLGQLTEGDSEKLAVLDNGLAAKPDPETKGMLLINKALLLDRQGKRDEAITILGTIAVDPASPLGVEHLAKFTLRQLPKSAPANARDRSSTAPTKKDIGDALAASERGRTLAMQGDLEASIKEFDRSLALNPTIAQTWADRAAVRATMKDWKGVVADTTEAIRIDPACVQALRSRASAHLWLQNESAALVDFGEAIRLAPSFPDTYRHRAIVRAQQGDISNAIKDCEKALEVAPENWSLREETKRRLADLRQRK